MLVAGFLTCAAFFGLAFFRVAFAATFRGDLVDFPVDLDFRVTILPIDM